MATVCVEVIRCNTCGRLGVSINDMRITSHKCMGHWTAEHVESMPSHRITEAIRVEPAPRKKARSGKGKRRG